MNETLYWLFAIAFLVVGALALGRPELILRMRARIRPYESPDANRKRRRANFGALEVRICAVALLAIGAVLLVRLLT